MNIQSFSKSLIKRSIEYPFLCCMPAWLLVGGSQSFCAHKPILMYPILLVSTLSISIWFYTLWRLLNSNDSDWRSHKPESRGIFLYYLFTIAVCFFIAWFTGPRFDYVDYVMQWTQLSANGVLAPWTSVPSNTYGPIHMIFAPLAFVNHLLPKISFMILLIAILLYTTFKPVNAGKDLSPEQKYLVFLYTFASPFVVISFWIYGINDEVSSFFMVLAIFAVQSRLSKPTLATGISAISLSIATMHKLYPIVLLPFLVYRNRKIDFSYISFFALGIGLILAISYSFWGLDMLHPVLFASKRSAEHLSIFNALFSIGIDINSMSSFAMLAGTGVIFLLFRSSGLSFVNASFFGFIVFIFFYKVGHTAYYTFAMLMSPYLFRRWKVELAAPAYRKLTAIYIAWLGFINLYVLEYVITCQMTVDTSGRVFRYYGGFPFALLTTGLVVTGIRYLSSPLSKQKSV